MSHQQQHEQVQEEGEADEEAPPPMFPQQEVPPQNNDDEPEGMTVQTPSEAPPMAISNEPLQLPRASSDPKFSPSSIVRPWKCVICDYENNPKGNHKNKQCGYCGANRTSSSSAASVASSTTTTASSIAGSASITDSSESAFHTTSRRTEDPGVKELPSPLGFYAPRPSGNYNESGGGGDEESYAATRSVSSTSRSSDQSSALLSSLRQTVDSISDRLLELAQSAEDSHPPLFVDESGAFTMGGSSSQLLAAAQSRACTDSGAIRDPTSNATTGSSALLQDHDLEELGIFTDDRSNAPVAAPADDISFEELFTAGQPSGAAAAAAAAEKVPSEPVISTEHVGKDVDDNEKEEEKQPETAEEEEEEGEAADHLTQLRFSGLPQSPPSLSRMVGFEALPPSSQRQPKTKAVEPWEIPSNAMAPHAPDLTATMPVRPSKHRRRHGTNNKKTEEDDDDDSVNSVPPALRMIRLVTCFVVILVLVLSILLVRNRSNQRNSGTNASNEGRGVLVTPSPVTSLPTPTPHLRPTRSPTVAPIVTQFTTQAILDGHSAGSRLGTQVAMDQEGTVLAALDNSGAVHVYRNNNNNSMAMMARNGPWQLVSSMGLVYNDPTSYLDLQNVGSFPMLAVASTAGVRVWVYDSATNAWRPRGQAPLDWNATTAVTSPSVALSSTGKNLIMAHIDEGGMQLVVQVWQWNANSMLWERQGGPILRTTTTSPFQFLSVAISSNHVVAIGDWRIAIDAVTVEVYRWYTHGESWVRRGSAHTFPWGPPDVVLTDDGNCFAVATPTPGRARVYHWNAKTLHWDTVGNDLSGGSSIAISGNGHRVIVGSPIASAVVIYDLLIDRNRWNATTTLSGTVGDQFGASLDLSASGNTIVVGSPLNDAGGRDAGKVIVYA